ncbi:hypothetical protein EYR38_010089 [Pleurotus pulmonarius]|nr:hypothetical protein EYR38_010089 [Pleurotus pulmonarius]
MALSRTPSLTPSPSSSPSPEPLVIAQPDHFYGADPTNILSQHSDVKTWLIPEDDPLAHRGIPVFRPTMEEFKDFEAYMRTVECWGARSGIVKIIPPQEWTDSLPSVTEPLKQVKIKSPIEQHMLGRGGLFRQENVEKRKHMSVREWVELCGKDEFRAPAIEEVGLHARSATVQQKPRRGRKKPADEPQVQSVEVEDRRDGIVVKQEADNGEDDASALRSASVARSYQSISFPPHIGTPVTPEAESLVSGPTTAEDASSKPRPKRNTQTRQAREASLADKAARDSKFFETFDPHKDWLPPNTKATDYTPEFCHSLERQYWRNCGLSKPAWYGADSQGSLFTDETKYWNVGHLESTLSRLLPSSDKGLPGVNTPYLYFGMWRATFAWHVEDMDLFSINYIHFGAPKFWYAVPQGRAAALEQTMRGYFPKDTSQCPQFLRHKSFLASPTLLAQSACRPNHLVQHAGEIVVTFPRGYHAGFNLGLNCAESVNFALDSWLDLGKRAKICECVSDSVRIDVTQLLLDRAIEAAYAPPPQPQRISKDSRGRSSKKRKSDTPSSSKPKKAKTKPTPSSEPVAGPSGSAPSRKIHVTLKLGPKPSEPEDFPCCLCTSMSQDGLLRVHEPPLQRRDAVEAAHNPKQWMAHEICANVIPETWVDELSSPDGTSREKAVFGVDGIVKDRWNLKCSACSKTRDKTHGAPIQCTKGKCPKAFHVSCAQGGSEHGVVFNIIRDVEKEVVLADPSSSVPQSTLDPSLTQTGPPMDVDPHPSPDVLKVIKKFEVNVLCAQHNPAVAAAKRANKQDKIRNELLALPSMARIKIRVSAGVFEVSLIRVIEESNSVEVLWDRGMKREFKWGSVVFGSTEGPIHQKPSEVVVEPQASTSTLPVITYPSLSAATSATTIPAPPPPTAPSHPQQPPQSMPVPYLQLTPRGISQHDYWPKQGSYAPQPAHYPYAYPQLYQHPPAGFPPLPYSQYYYAPIGGAAGQLQWQQPYQGPMLNAYAVQRPAVQGVPAPQVTSQQDPVAPNSASQLPSQTSSTPIANTSVPVTLPPATESLAKAQDIIPSIADSTLLKELAQKAMLDLNTLSSLHPTQLADILRTNPALREVVSAAIERHKVQGTVSFS